MNLLNIIGRTAFAATILSTCASGATIVYSTNGAGTGFNNTSLLTQGNSVGAASTLSFTPNVNATTGVPSNVNYGDFLLVCATCSTQAMNAGSFYAPFTFNLLLTDVTDGATGRFVGTSSGGNVFSDVSQITITWLPGILGPGTINALTGNFGPTSFNINQTTRIVAPNSGTPPGATTVQGTVNSTTIPEPATYAVVGFALLGLGVLRRRIASR